MDPEQMRREAQRVAAMQAMALTVLLERAGGQVTITEAEYRAITERYGGPALMAIHAEALGPTGGNPDEIRVSLVRKPAGQGELVS